MTSNEIMWMTIAFGSIIFAVGNMVRSYYVQKLAEDKLKIVNTFMEYVKAATDNVREKKNEKCS